MAFRTVAIIGVFWGMTICVAIANSWHHATHPSDYVTFPDEGEHTDQSAR